MLQALAMSRPRALPAPPTATRYLQARFRDYLSLTHEVAEAPRFAQGKDLGYCFLMGSTVYTDGGIFPCAGRDEALALILDLFW